MYLRVLMSLLVAAGPLQMSGSGPHTTQPVTQLSRVDHDGDGWCLGGGYDENGDGDCNDPTDRSFDQYDCDDGSPFTNPDANEVLGTPWPLCQDGEDNDCDGLVDDADPSCANEDRDGDRWCVDGGYDVNGDGVCEAGVDNRFTQYDCDEWDPGINPDANERQDPAWNLCSDGRDNDCDGLVDDADPSCANEDRDGDGWCVLGGYDVNGDGVCEAGVDNRFTQYDCDDWDEWISPDANERQDPAWNLCSDGRDNDCDGLVDDDDPSCANEDRDGDGWCINGGYDVNGDGVCEAGVDNRFTQYDCDDWDAYISPDAYEHQDPIWPLCSDGRDNDCDGQIDDDDSSCGNIDRDGDRWCPLGGYDENDDGDCEDAVDSRFSQGDCDEWNFWIHPGAVEICNNGVDDNCDGVIDPPIPYCNP